MHWQCVLPLTRGAPLYMMCYGDVGTLGQMPGKKALALIPAHINPKINITGVLIFMRGSPNFYENGHLGSPLSLDTGPGNNCQT